MMTHATTLLLLAVSVSLLAIPLALPAQAAEADELTLLRERLVASFLPKDDAAGVREAATARDLLARMRPDGTWDDVDYADQTRSGWKADAHVRRLVTMARALRAKGSGLKDDRDLVNAIVRGLFAWFERDPQNPNWWNNQIGVPHIIGEVLLLLGKDLPSGVLAGGRVVLERSDYVTYIGARRVEWNGANLADMAKSRVMLGILVNDHEMVATAFEKAWGEIRVVAPGEEGIQADFSFHQHGSLIYDGGYGEVFAQDIARFLHLARGTRFEPSTAQRDLFDRYLLEGPRWMVRGRHYDYGVIGRGISRSNRTAKGLAAIAGLMASVPGPRRKEYAALAKSIEVGGPPPVTGNRHFWRSDYMVHARKGWMATARGHSTRTFNTDGSHNGEGVRSHFLGDGSMFLYRDGEEYHDVFPGWDWRKIPGTTVTQSSTPLDPNRPEHKGATDLVGGVSDGTYGMAVMDLKRGSLAARKAWMFFENEAVCLGAGITDTSGDPVATTANQCLLRGPVETDGSSDHPGRWVLHDGFGYLFAEGTPVRMKRGDVTGRWSDIGVGSSSPVTVPVFTLWIDHGPRPDGASYRYTVVPNATPAGLRKRARQNAVDVLSNTPAQQAAWHEGLGLLMAAFYEPGEVRTGEGLSIAADRPCLVLLRRTGDAWRIAVSNPNNQALEVTVTLRQPNSQPIAERFDLPDGPEAGRSVVREIPRSHLP